MTFFLTDACETMHKIINFDCQKFSRQQSRIALTILVTFPKVTFFVFENVNKHLFLPMDLSTLRSIFYVINTLDCA